jgi:histone acetyltransferase MYST4
VNSKLLIPFQGFGRLLIDFSYLLSKSEKQAGTPEKPLSDLGRVSYHSYWKSIILEYLSNHRDGKHVTVQSIQADTSLHSHDIALTFMLLGFIRKSVDNKFILAIDWSKVDAHMDRVEKSLKAGTRINLDPDALRWTPIVSGHDLFRSPYKGRDQSLSPLKSPPSGASSNSPLRKKRRTSNRDQAHKSTTSEEEQDSDVDENMSLNKQRQLMQKKKRLQKLKKNLNLSGECKGLDGGGATQNISHERQRANKSGSRRRSRAARPSQSGSSSYCDDDDADDEDEELELLSAKKHNNAAARNNTKTTSKTISQKSNTNKQDSTTQEAAGRYRRAAANKASHRISKDSRRSMSMSSSEPSSLSGMSSEDNEDTKRAAQMTEQRPSRKRKLSETEKENCESNAPSGTKQLSWPEQIARIKARNVPSRASADSTDSLEPSTSAPSLKRKVGRPPGAAAAARADQTKKGTATSQRYPTCSVRLVRFTV